MIDIKHDCIYFNENLPHQFEHEGFGHWGITDAKLKMISPDKYFKDVVELVGSHTPLDACPQNREIIQSMKERTNTTDFNNKNNRKWDIPFILVDTSSDNLSYQDGRHRMALMKEMDIKEVPCLYLYKTKVKKEEKTMNDNTNLLIDSPTDYFLTEMKSKNNGRDSKGFLVCTNVVAARTGIQKYLGSELGVVDQTMLNDIFELSRTSDEVFSIDTMKSFNGIPFTNNHPVGRVTSKNSKDLIRGMVQNPRKSKYLDNDGNELLLVDVVVTDEDTIKEIENGKIEVSAGYAWDYEVVNLKKRQLKIKNIRANHLALVDRGRAGSAMILDEKIGIEELIIDSNNEIEELNLEGGEIMKEIVHKFSHKNSDGKKKILEVRGITDKELAKQEAIAFLKDQSTKGGK